MYMERSVLEARLEKLEHLLENIQDALLCPICLEVVRGPVRQCVEGHPICEQCLFQSFITSCPTCSRPISLNRNIAMEQVSNAVIYKCNNVENGCGELGMRIEIEAHAVVCPYRQYECPCPSCIWSGFKPELQVHMTSKHPQSVITTNNQVLRIPLEGNQNSIWVLFLWDEIFLITFNMNQDEDALIGSISCLDNSMAADRYKYRTYLKTQDNEITFAGSIRTTSDISGLTSDIESVIYIPSSLVKNCLEVRTSWPPDGNTQIEVRVSVEDTVSISIYEERGLIQEERAEAARLREDVSVSLAGDGTGVSVIADVWQIESEETRKLNIESDEENEGEEINCFFDAEQFITEELRQDPEDRVLIERVKEKVARLLKVYSCESPLKKKIDIYLNCINRLMKGFVKNFSSYLENYECDITTMYTIAELRRTKAFLANARVDIARSLLSTTEEGASLLNNQSRKAAALEAVLMLIVAEVEGSSRFNEWLDLKPQLSDSVHHEFHSKWDERRTLLYDEGAMRLLSKVEQKLGPEAVERTIRHLANMSDLITDKEIDDIVNNASFIRWSKVEPA